MRRSAFTPVIALVAGIIFGGAALAGEKVVVRMGSEDEPFRFHPEISYIAVGDTVVFEASNHTYSSRSIANMCSGNVAWRGRLGETVSVRFDEPGIYGFRCDAHYNMGMVGLIVVGDNPPIDPRITSSRPPPAAKEEFSRLLDEVRRHSGTLASSQAPE